MERSCRENLGLVRLTGMDAPDYNTLWEFWQSPASSLVVAAEVVNAAADVHQLVPLLDQVKDNLKATA